MSLPRVVLTVAGSDPLGGAGIQADLATFAAHDVHGVSAVTSVSAQSLTEITSVVPIDPSVVCDQLDGIIDTFEVSAVKTGMLRQPEVIEMVAERVEAGDLPSPVVDPVMVDGRGVRFIDEAAFEAYRDVLFPLARVITPNRAEAEILVGVDLPDADAVLGHAQRFRDLGVDVVVTGGAFVGPPDDVVITADASWTLEGQRVATDNVRGSGCTFAAATACGLAHGQSLEQAVLAARDFVKRAIARSADWQVGGPGPISHGFVSQSTSAQSSP